MCGSKAAQLSCAAPQRERRGRFEGKGTYHLISAYKPRSFLKSWGRPAGGGLSAAHKGKNNGLQQKGPVRSLRPQAPSARGGFEFYLIRATEYRFRREGGSGIPVLARRRYLYFLPWVGARECRPRVSGGKNRFTERRGDLKRFSERTRRGSKSSRSAFARHGPAERW